MKAALHTRTTPAAGTEPAQRVHLVPSTGLDITGDSPAKASPAPEAASRAAEIPGAAGAGGAGVDVAKRYQAMRNREGMAWAERMQEEARVAGSGVELNKWLSEGPVILSESLAPAAAVAVDPDTTQSMRRQAPRAGGASALGRGGGGRAARGGAQADLDRLGRKWDSNVTLGERKSRVQVMAEEHGVRRQVRAREPVTDTADLWAAEVSKDRAQQSRRVPIQGSAYEPGNAGVASRTGNKKGSDADFRRQLTQAERQSLEELREMLSQSNLISNISPSLLQAAGLRDIDPSALSLGLGAGDGIEVLGGGELELLMDPGKKRRVVGSRNAKGKGGSSPGGRASRSSGGAAGLVRGKREDTRDSLGPLPGGIPDLAESPGGINRRSRGGSGAGSRGGTARSVELPVIDTPSRPQSRTADVGESMPVKLPGI